MPRLLPLVLCFVVAAAGAQTYEPYEGQPGKDVVWVPTRPALVETMLNLANVTERDVVVDLGSGDGRMVIAAAKRGARAIGIEYEPDMVALARRNAAAAGVAERAQFVQGDMFQADFSQATVLALFLLPANLRRLTPKFLELAPGTRIVVNTYRIEGWDEETFSELGDACASWCTALLYLVPAKVAGRWHLPIGDLELAQDAQRISGTLTPPGGRKTGVTGRLSGERIRFTVAGSGDYTGRVHGAEMSGDAKGSFSGFWKATRLDSGTQPK
ncbi:MAG TPA: class I SAM-dependent methyltransferase [Burkholderiales bacterium]|nr:class I SAM-dependent methyltransferase [Burkholderiales bacterium]